MNKLFADMHLHSKYSRAVSANMTLEAMSEWGAKKGIDLMATGDWTHPLWFKEIRQKLVEVNDGIFEFNKMKYLLATEVSSIYKQNGRVRRVHTLIWTRNFFFAEKINRELLKRGCNLSSDGRPILGLPVKNLAEMVFEIDELALVIPAHIWTPWFSVFGAFGGFESLEEAFGEVEERIIAVETGLSSDPLINWRVSELDNRAILSFSDAHSLQKIGREVTVFEVQNKISQLSYIEVFNAIKQKNIAYTVEFFPEEGKYHYDGHRSCGVVLIPKEAKEKKFICSVCGKGLTRGVVNRVEGVADREEVKIIKKTDAQGVCWNFHPESNKPPFMWLVPLDEIIAEVLGVGVGSVRVKKYYEYLVSELGNELEILLHTSIGDIQSIGDDKLARAIFKVRGGQVVIEPGYDGVYGKIKIEA